ncbi:MAG: HNH endonuclease [Lachnospiraceae bacterium]|nr:HNH endonuclease [Lachnospiraceae bacterium]
MSDGGKAAIALIVVVIIVIIAWAIHYVIEEEYRELESEVLKKLGFPNWDIISYSDEYVTVKSRQALDKYDDIKFFKENKDKLEQAEIVMKRKNEVVKILRRFLEDNEYKTHSQYRRLEEQIYVVIKRASTYRISVSYITYVGNRLGQKHICLNQCGIEKFRKDPSLLMGKGEYNKYLKEQQKEALAQKHHGYYERVNRIIDYANENKDTLIIKDGQEQLDGLIAQLFDRTVNSIKKIKTIDSEEWDVIGDFIDRLKADIEKVVTRNRRILEYYESSDFSKIKETCEALMSSQREFNEYITEKIQSISQLFGTRVVRNETINEDEYNYIRPYKKTITPFTAEVSANVFASAENKPLEYVVKNFYPNKTMYPEQIQKLYLLIEELETLKEAKQIIENYKVEYQQYLGDVPDYIMEEDESGFYSRLGFANIDESVLGVEYKFAYTSGGGMAQRSFTVPMTEETIVELIKKLESKLTASAFAKEQRTLMTKRLRESVKKRDNYTCCSCGNSIHAEPNLLLEIDHIIPIARGGCTVEENLQTLCWKCNRAKSDKVLD